MRWLIVNSQENLSIVVLQPDLKEPNSEKHQGEEFSLHLDVFQGPLDLLLSLIAKHKLDITEVALAQVTDEFIAYYRKLRADFNQETLMRGLNQASEFVVIAATLLDLKTLRLLPKEEQVDEDSFEILRARDLLFGRLIKYQTYKTVSSQLQEMWQQRSNTFWRNGFIEEIHKKALPELHWNTKSGDLKNLAENALRGMREKHEPPEISLQHFHRVKVSIAEQLQNVSTQLKENGRLQFWQIVQDQDDKAIVVARFLAVFELLKYALAKLSLDVQGSAEIWIEWTHDSNSALSPEQLALKVENYG